VKLSGIPQTYSGHYLYQDMSAAAPKVIPPWFEIFERQAVQPEFWREDRVEGWVLSLRNDIAAAGSDIDNIKDAIANWIKWVK
jgi:hypothetical protein